MLLVYTRIIIFKYKSKNKIYFLDKFIAASTFLFKMKMSRIKKVYAKVKTIHLVIFT